MNINFSAPICSTGYGIASLNILKNLHNLSDGNLSLFPIGQISVQNQSDYSLCELCASNAEDFDIHAPHIKIWHQFDLAQRIGKGKYYSYSFFELDTLSNKEIKHLSVPDHIFASSEWAKSIISNHNVTADISVVPLGVDRNIFDEQKYPIEKPYEKYTFLNIGKWEIRKGHDILLDLFQKAFPTEQDVELWMVAAEHTNGYSKEAELKQWKAMYMVDPRIKICTGVNDQIQIAQIISESSCGLYPSRAEGWNLELLETMSMNRPVIATNYSSHTEFCTQENSLLVEVDELEEAYDGKAFLGQGKWAKIGVDQKDQIIEHMRHSYKTRVNTNESGVLTAKKYSWMNSALSMYGVLSNAAALSGS